ncbi:hypothetical protein BC829DRAFT_382353 [Chytridium lagenaria]|nr:hypothetical protein BC829DRAFT_382353 [Chytridium lagenaria]
MLTLLAVPVLIHTTASVTTTASLEAANWTLNKTLHWTPVLIGKSVVVLQRAQTKAKQAWDRYSPDLITFLSASFSRLWSLTERVTSLFLASTKSLLKRLQSSIHHFGTVIHDSGIPAIYGAAKLTHERVAGLYPHIQSVIKTSGAALWTMIERVAAASVAFYQAAVPVWGRCRETLREGWRLLTVGLDRLGDFVHACLNDLHTLLERSRIRELFRKIPQYIAVVGRFGLSMAYSCINMVHYVLESTYLFLESRAVFAKAAALVSSMTTVMVKYTVATTLIWSKLVIKLLAYTKSLAHPLIHAFWEASQPLWVLVERTMANIRSGVLFETLGLRVAFEAVSKLVAWSVVEIRGKVIPFAIAAWEDMRRHFFKVSPKKTD